MDNSLDKFVDMVAAMRKAQKKYFVSRDTSALMMAKSLEKEVDKAVKEMLAGRSAPESPVQTSLFGNQTRRNAYE